MHSQGLRRRLSLLQATAINMTDMVGIGPFITLPMVIMMMNGPYFLYAWIAGAILSVLDAMIWSELGAALPRAGGSFNFLKEAYGRDGAGKLMSFLFVWQTMIQAPLVIASAAIAFSKYFSFLVPLSPLLSKILSGSVVILIIILLYRKIESIGKISIFMCAGVLITLLWIIGGGIAHGHFLEPIRHINEGIVLNYGFITAIGFASVKTVYSYLGYYNVCHLGGEIINPSRNIPRSMFISIFTIALLYLLMNISITSVIPWQTARSSEFVVSIFIRQLMGNGAAQVITCLILWVAFASVFSATLGYSRIPYAAAEDGAFFGVFKKLHPSKGFPHISLLFLGGLGFIFSLLFRLSEVISAILAMRILIQFIGQGIGLILLRRKKSLDLPFKMPLYPLPALIAMAMWLFVLISTGRELVLLGLGIISLGILVYLIRAKWGKEWPFSKKELFVDA